MTIRYFRPLYDLGDMFAQVRSPLYYTGDACRDMATTSTQRAWMDGEDNDSPPPETGLRLGAWAIGVMAGRTGTGRIWRNTENVPMEGDWIWGRYIDPATGRNLTITPDVLSASQMRATNLSTGLDSSVIEPIMGTWTPGTPEDANPSDVVLTQLTGWGQGFTQITPTEEAMAGFPVSARPFASATVPNRDLGGSRVILDTDGVFSIVAAPGGNTAGHTAASLMGRAREVWRDTVRSRIRLSAVDETERQNRERHRVTTERNFLNFARRESETEEHVASLPFVPHGLASSRRWGIEVESGGARDVETPGSWRRVGDGSLRSAYDGYVEVQTFEPYDEERQRRVYSTECEFADRHNPRIEYYDAGRDEHLWILRDNWLDPRRCESCGHVTETVRVEPQTIRHQAQPGDCAEFVSPILVSMHSKGLEYLSTELGKRPQNSSSGVHVHVEADDLTTQQIATLVYGYDILEPLLEASYRRERRDFCHRREAPQVLEAARAARGRGNFDPQGGGRYVTLNTHSLSAHGTIEFRAMGPVYDYEYLTRWAMLCRELVNSVAAGATNRDFAKIKSWDNLLSFLARFGKEYIRASVYEMSGETGEVAKLEKEGTPVTTEALDADLRALLIDADVSVLVGARGTAEI